MMDGELFPDLPQSFSGYLPGVSVVVNVQLLQTSYLSVVLNPSLKPLTFRSCK